MPRMTPDQAEAAIRDALVLSLRPTSLIIENESHLHLGHAGDDGSRATHFHVTLGCESFAGRNRVECHRMVYNALDGLIGKPIHALRIDIQAQ
ncbi:MAG: BolA family protein [Pseudomonadota bacterium]